MKIENKNLKMTFRTPILRSQSASAQNRPPAQQEFGVAMSDFAAQKPPSNENVPPNQRRSWMFDRLRKKHRYWWFGCFSHSENQIYRGGSTVINCDYFKEWVSDFNPAPRKRPKPPPGPDELNQFLTTHNSNLSSWFFEGIHRIQGTLSAENRSDCGDWFQPSASSQTRQTDPNPSEGPLPLIHRVPWVWKLNFSRGHL